MTAAPPVRVAAALVGPARQGPIRLSVVVPCFNEDAVMAATHARLAASLRTIPNAKAEIIYVDDGVVTGRSSCCVPSPPPIQRSGLSLSPEISATGKR